MRKVVKQFWSGSAAVPGTKAKEEVLPPRKKELESSLLIKIQILCSHEGRVHSPLAAAASLLAASPALS